MVRFLNVFFLLYCLFIATILLLSEAFSNEKETNLHLYLHENLSGPDATSIIVVSPNSTSCFGATRVFRNELREGSEPTSKLIGQTQGMGTTASQDGSSLVEASFVFTDGKYRGSTLAIFGRPVRRSSSSWEVNIIGGTGQFHLAWGYGVGKNLVNVPSKTIIGQFDLYFIHSDRKI